MASGLKGKLVVTVHRARDLHNVQMIGKQDPYVLIHVGNEKFKTKVINNGGIHPTWEQSFLFNLTGVEDACHFLVNDAELVGDRPIGRLDVPLHHLVQTKGEQWFQLLDVNNFAKMAGQLLLSIEFTGTGLIASSTKIEQQQSPPPQQPVQQQPPTQQPVYGQLPPQQSMSGQLPGQPCGGYNPQQQPMLIPLLDANGQHMRDQYGNLMYQQAYPPQGYPQPYPGQPPVYQPAYQPPMYPGYPPQPQQPQPIAPIETVPVPIPAPVPAPTPVQPVIPEQKKPEIKDIDHIITPDNYAYQLIHELNNPYFIFAVKASNDAHIALSTNHTFSSGDNQLYEIVLGGWGNEKSAMRRACQGQNHVHVDTSQIVSPHEYRNFWISWLNGHICMGQGQIPYQHIIMEWKDHNPLNVRYVGICTGWGATGHWYIPKQPRHVTTPDSYNYQLVHDITPSTSSFIFRVRASNDAHIALSSDATFPSGDHKLYEIVLGGWGNAKSAIRRERQGGNHVNPDTPQIVTSQQYHTFWISWLHGHVMVGRGGYIGQQVIMEWKDHHALQIKHIGVCTGWGATGDWWILPIQSNKPITTPDRYDYTHVTDINPYISPSFTMLFHVRASNDAHLALSTDPSFPSGDHKLYEIVLGGWGNGKSAIRRERQGGNHLNPDTPQIVSPHEHRTFWISYSSQSGILCVGTGYEVNQRIVMKWHDSHPLAITSIGICTGWGATGDWVIEPLQALTLHHKELRTPDNYAYQLIQNIHSHINHMIFEVTASNDAHIALSRDDSFSNGDHQLYEIVLGGWGNSRSVIRRGRQSQELTACDTPNLLSSSQPHTFWISWLNGHIRVGHGHVIHHHVMMECKDNNPIPIHAIGGCTGWGATGSWIFY